MAYIWSYLKRYPNWLWLDLLGAMLFVTVILGMPTALAGMIDNGVTKGDRTGVYLWTFIMFIFCISAIRFFSGPKPPQPIISSLSSMTKNPDFSIFS